jgi:hypothetical protein
MMALHFSDTIVYVDESGDHGTATIDAGYPVFVLLFAIFKKSSYINRFVPAIGNLKFRLFGHDGVIFHEREIRKDLGPFAVLRDPDRKAQFFEEVTEIIERTPFEVIATVHDKRALLPGAAAGHLYHEALRFGLERLYDHVRATQQHATTTHVVCEARGGNEDRELTVAFQRACAGQNEHRAPLPFNLVVTDKRANSAGLQLADLMARPVGLHVLRPEQANRAFEVISTKVMRDPVTDAPGWGLRCFP